ncbi:unnamed protein product [Brachionus calyciflorus]|uniref:Uncharacterized protein n=1 Tax=Brachionus calyciflorus TaxID=104777 RepID=A0A813RLN3_9BILA|nr:unnamed protein product [Brachionus calyciflorus]
MDESKLYHSIIMSHKNKTEELNEEILNINTTLSDSIETITLSVPVGNSIKFKLKKIHQFFVGMIRRKLNKIFFLNCEKDSLNEKQNTFTIYLNSSKIQMLPLHSLVLPTNDKNSTKQHTKLFVLPFGSLSGVYNKPEICFQNG